MSNPNKLTIKRDLDLDNNNISNINNLSALNLNVESISSTEIHFEDGVSFEGTDVQGWNSLSANILSESQTRYVNISGDTMTGPLSTPSLSTDNLFVSNSSIHFFNGTTISSPEENKIFLEANTRANSLILHPTSQSAAFTGQVYSEYGALAGGSTFGGAGTSISAAAGSIAFGRAFDSSAIHAGLAATGGILAAPSLAFGYASGNSYIQSTGRGSLALGYTLSGHILSNGEGSIALGSAYIDNPLLLSDGTASIALGNAVSATGNASLATGFRTLAAGDVAVAIGRDAHTMHDSSYVWNGSLDTISSDISSQYKVNAVNGVVLGQGGELRGDWTVTGDISTGGLTAQEISVDDVTFTGETLTTEVSTLTAEEYMVVNVGGESRLVQLYSYN